LGQTGETGRDNWSTLWSNRSGFNLLVRDGRDAAWSNNSIRTLGSSGCTSTERRETRRDLKSEIGRSAMPGTMYACRADEILMTMMPATNSAAFVHAADRAGGSTANSQYQMDRLVPGRCNKKNQKGMPTYHTRVATDGWLPVKICSRQVASTRSAAMPGRV